MSKFASFFFFVTVVASSLFVATLGQDGDEAKVVYSGKGFTREGKQEYTRLQIEMDFSKINPKDRGCNGLTFLLKVRHKSNNENENAVSHGVSTYDVLPAEASSSLQHDDKYFGQMVLGNAVTSIEMSEDGGKTWTLPFRTSAGFNKHATDSGLWLSRAVAIYPLTSKGSDDARDNLATLDTRDSSDLSGDVWIGFLPLLGQFHDRVRYTIESLDGVPLMKKSPGEYIQLLLSKANGQTPKKIANALRNQILPRKFKEWSFSGTVKFADGGSYSDDGPIKTVVPIRPPRPISEAGKKANERMNEESEKLEAQFERDRVSMEKQFEDVRKDLEEMAEGFRTGNILDTGDDDSEFVVADALAEAEAAAAAVTAAAEVASEPVVEPEAAAEVASEPVVEPEAAAPSEQEEASTPKEQEAPAIDSTSTPGGVDMEILEVPDELEL